MGKTEKQDQKPNESTDIPNKDPEVLIDTTAPGFGTPDPGASKVNGGDPPAPERNEFIESEDFGETEPDVKAPDPEPAPEPAPEPVAPEEPKAPPAPGSLFCPKCSSTSIGMAGGMRRCNQCGHAF